MNATVLSILLSFVSTSVLDGPPARPTILDRRISVRLEAAGLLQAIQTVAKAARVGLRIDKRARELAEIVAPVSISASEEPLGNVVSEMLRVQWPGPQLTYGARGRTLWVIPAYNLPDTRVNLDLKAATLSDSLKSLLSQTPVNYVFAVPRDQPREIRLSAQDDLFEAALVRLLRSVYSTRRFDYAGSEDIYCVPGGILRPSEHLLYVLPVPPPFQAGEGRANDTKISGRLKGANIRWVLKSIMTAAGRNYVLDNDVTGPVHAEFDNLGFEDALAMVLAPIQKDGKKIIARFEDGVYVFDAVMTSGKGSQAEATVALFKALENSDESGARAAIHQGASAKARDSSRATPLHWAASRGLDAIMKLLIARGGDVRSRDEYGRPPLCWAIRSSLPKLDAIAFLTDRGADLKSVDRYGMTPLLWAVHQLDLDVVKYLMTRGASPNQRNQDGQTPVHRAAGYLLHHGNLGDSFERAYIEIVDILLGHGGKVNAGDKQGRTPLMLAAWHGHPLLLRFLIERGADPHAADKFGRNALSFSAHWGKTDRALQFLKEQQLPARYLDHLILEGYDPSTPLPAGAIRQRGSFGETLLMVASEKEHVDLVNRLIGLGADVNARDELGNTALIYAIGGRSRGSQAGFRLWPKRGETEAMKEIVKMLLAAGARTNLVNQHDETAFSGAQGKRAVDNLLRSASKSRR